MALRNHQAKEKTGSFLADTIYKSALFVCLPEGEGCLLKRLITDLYGDPTKLEANPFHFYKIILQF
ncbi:MAG TPA: hypothetical protein VMU83_10245 [Hanamia sp.]|nr:hypothetical protein [Hanamia sp.]